uniref:DUF4503 domain-containing protein n=1 Tax=Pygocentrus nattereri TaxID=42514 RepID=A0AAR2KDJ1_PYGNA
MCGTCGIFCGMQAALCERPYEKREPCVALFSKDTATHLAPAVGDTICVYPPWFCMLVQDVYGVFSEVELQYVSSEVELKHRMEQLEGKVCVLQGLKVIQRLTRERCTKLFSLIDSLWPPLIPLRVHGEQSCHQTDRVPSPSFCYRLAGQQGAVLPQHVSPLYRPPVVLTLQEVLQNEPTSGWCSFKAVVVYKREQSVGEDLLLFVTDSSLQSTGSTSRTLPVYVSTSCLLQTCIREAITSPHLRPTLVFRDAVMENGRLFCWEQSVIQLESEQSFFLPQPVLLDQLSSESAACSLCTLTGVVIDVDEESAFSWPACSRCGSDCLEAIQTKQEAFLCATCGAVDTPTTKMQLEVFISCPLLNHCTVKVKLQQKSIMSLLNSTGCAEKYEVENVLGKEVGPLRAFIHVISKRTTLWMSLDEIIL